MSHQYSHNDWLTDNQEYLTLQLQIIALNLKSKIAGNEGMAPHKSNSNIEHELAVLRTSMQSSPALDRLVNVFGLSEFEKNTLLLCAGMELDSKFHSLVHALNGTGQVTFALALSVFRQSHWSAITPGGALRFWRMIETGRSAMLTQAPLTIEEGILHYLTGVGEINDKLANYIGPLRYSELIKDQQGKFKDIFKNELNAGHIVTLFAITGSDADHRCATALSLAEALGRMLFVVNASHLPIETEEIYKLSGLWRRESLLKKFCLLLECDTVDAADKQRSLAVSQFISKIETPILISTDGWIPDTTRPKKIIQVPKPTEDEQLALWKQGLDNPNGVTEMLQRIVSQFSLTNHTIRRAASEWNALKIDDEPVEATGLEKKLWKICSKYASPQLDGLAQQMEPMAGWDDLVLPEQQKNVLKEIIVHVKNRNTVYNRWGFSLKGARGLGISTLFAGESGTGKTMASEVLANELNLDLYKIDLSRVVNKYIGETEKNLKRIFDAAENGGAILLFDEADALFGKRSEVKDSHDRYANIEVSYLLQRIETYRGLAILTTNMKMALDKAFIRRIRFIVQFPFPDAIQRAEIWSRVFPDKTPTGQLDINRLSKFTITGGNIRNIAMNAAFLAANDGGHVEMEHIIKAAKTEYAKLEMPLTGELKNLA